MILSLYKCKFYRHWHVNISEEPQRSPVFGKLQEMNIKSLTPILLLLVLLATPAVNAGVGICGEEVKFEESCTSPWLRDPNDPKKVFQYPCQKSDDAKKIKVDTNLSEEQAKQVPALIYYSVDTNEPFMKATVDYEIKKLRQACRTGNKVNFVVFLNSLYMGEHGQEKHLFLYCGQPLNDLERMDELSEERFHVYKLPVALVEKLEAKRTLIELGLYSNEDTNERILFQTRYKKELGPVFARFPLAHPDFFYDLIEETRRSIFSKDKGFLPFLHLKSHGSRFSLLTGLTESQEIGKNSCQEKIMNASHSYMKDWWSMVQSKGVGLTRPPENRFLISPFAKVSDEVTVDSDFSVECDETCDAFGLAEGTWRYDDGRLGNSGGLNPEGNGLNVEINGLNVELNGLNPEGNSLNVSRNGLSTSDFGLGGFETSLGVSYDDIDGNVPGLKIENSFGTPYLKMNQILSFMTYQRPGSPQVNNPFGFIMFESCESQVSGKGTLFDYTKANLTEVKGFYSAEGTLWYRNINWHYLLLAADGNAGHLQKLLVAATLGITNRVVKKEDTPEDSDGE